MARKIRDVTIEAEGRDQGKTYRLTEMPALQAEKWAARAALALGRSGVDIPDEVRQQGAAAVMTIGLRAFVGIEFADAEPLMDEMLECVRFVRDPKHPELDSRIFDGDVEEPATLLFLRGQLMELHTGFTVRAALSMAAAAATEWMLSLLIQTSPNPSEQSSEQGLRAGPSLEPPLA